MGPIVRTLRWFLNTLFHQALAVVTIYAIWFACVYYSTPFSWHVILCTLGYFPLMAESIILFASDNVWSQEINKTTKYWIHGVVLCVSTIIVIVGTWCDSKFKIDWNQEHFHSAHSITGLISIIFMVISIILGLLAANTVLLSEHIRPVLLKFLHNSIGILGYVMGIVSLILGYHVEWFKFYATMEGVWTATVVTVLILCWSLYRACISLYEQGRALFRV